MPNDVFQREVDGLPKQDTSHLRLLSHDHDSSGMLSIEVLQCAGVVSAPGPDEEFPGWGHRHQEADLPLFLHPPDGLVAGAKRRSDGRQSPLLERAARVLAGEVLLTEASLRRLVLTTVKFSSAVSSEAPGGLCGVTRELAEAARPTGHQEVQGRAVEGVRSFHHCCSAESPRL